MLPVAVQQLAERRGDFAGEDGRVVGLGGAPSRRYLRGDPGSVVLGARQTAAQAASVQGWNPPPPSSRSRGRAATCAARSTASRRRGAASRIALAAPREIVSVLLSSNSPRR